MKNGDIMLSEIFYWTLNISIIGGLTGLIILILRKVKKLPRFAVYLLWILPLIRLWVPFGIANKYSLLNLLSKVSTKTVVLWEKTTLVHEFSMTNSIQAAESYFPITYKTDLLRSIFGYASLIWVIVAVAAILTAFVLYFTIWSLPAM